MRREGRLHGYEFSREESHKRVKACNKPTNRSKFRSKYQQERAGSPRCKALKKMKGQRNKAHASDMAANHKLDEWALHHTRFATLLADSFEEDDLDPSQQALPFDAFKAFLLSEHEFPTLPQHEEKYITNDDDNDKDMDNDDDEEEEVEEKGQAVLAEKVYDEDSDGSDWLDLGSTDGSEDEWFLC